MTHRTHMVILASSVFFLTAVVILLASFQFVSEPGGFFRLAERSEPASDTCFDSDSGANYFARGALSYRNWSFLDDCSIALEPEGIVETVYEGYCRSSTEPVIVQYNCSFGCQDGACLR